MCARDRVPLLGRAFDPVPHVGVDGGVRVSVRLDALLPIGLWTAGERLHAAERARRSRDACASWSWVFGRLRGEGHAPGVIQGGDDRPPDGPVGPSPAAEAAKRTRSRAANDDDAADDDDDGDGDGDESEPDPFSVAAAFASVPSPTAARRARPPETIAAETDAAGPFFGAVPEEVLHAILSRVGEDAFASEDDDEEDEPSFDAPPTFDASPEPSRGDERRGGASANLARIAATCRYLRDASRETAPGIRCRLYPHQRDALRAMVARESGGVGALAPHPALRRLAVRFRAEDEDGNGNEDEDADEDGPREARHSGGERRDRDARVAWALVSDVRDGAYFPGALHVGARPSSAYADVRGGIFADDPGLGKSVTALALVTRSRDALPSPPPGAGEITRGTPPSYVVPAPAGGKALERWWTRTPTAATDEAEALEIEAEAARRREKTKREEEEKARARREKDETETEEANARVGEEPDAPPPPPPSTTMTTVAPSIPSTPSHLFVPTDGSNLRASAAAEPSSPEIREPASSHWVTCDECGKWRRLPPGATPPAEGATWYCQLQQHLPPRQRSCAVPEEEQTEEEWTKEAMGCYRPGAETPCQERNVRLFLDAIRESRERDSRDRVDDTARHARLLVTWLRRGGRGANLEPGGEGLYAPSDMARPTRRILAKVLHLLPERERTADADAGADDDARGTPRGSRKRARRAPPARRADEDPALARGPWGLPDTFLYSLRLDVDALEEAAARRAEETFRDYRLRYVVGQRDFAEDDAQLGRGGRRRRREGGARGGGGRDDPAALAAISASASACASATALGSPRTRGAVAGGVGSPGFENRVRVFLSSATLVIVPDAALIEHWIGQIARHVRASSPGGARPLRVLAVGGMCAREASALEATLRARNDAAMGRDVAGGDPPGTHRARDFPPAETLARDYDVVLSTFDRMSQRSKGGDRDDLLRVHFLRLIVDEGHLLGSAGSETTRAQRVRAIRAERRWIMTGTPAPAVRASERGGGARGKMSRAMATATHDVAAAPHRAAAALHPLLDLVRAAPFGSSRALWHDAVLRPLRERRPEGIATLRRTLTRLLVRASKAELGLLPPLTRRAVRVPFAASHARAFNQLADLVRLNLLLADWNDPEHQESLLHRDRAQYARELYVNVRKACCVAGAIRVAPQEHDLCETLTLLARRRGVPAPVAWDFTLRTDHDDDRGSLAVVAGAEGLPANVASFAFAVDETNGDGIRTGSGAAAAAAGAGSYSAATVRDRGEERARRTEGERGRRAGAHLPGGVIPGASPPWLPATHPLSRVETALREGGACASCGDFSAVVLAPPCGCGVLCPSCAEPSPTRCAACGTPYDMQSTDHPDRAFHNDRPKWPVPHELIEWQPARVGADAMGHRGGHWSSDWRSTESSKVSWLIRRLRDAGAAPAESVVEDEDANVARAFTAEGFEWKAAAAAADADGTGTGTGTGLAGPHWPSGEASGEDTEATCSNPARRARAPAGWTASRKAVVYSAFWEHLQLVQARLADRGVPFALMVRHARAQAKAAELERFRGDPGCGVLLMDASGVVGLDLSFASLVVAMEPVPDASVLAQLEARAHRVGQTRPVEVEVLAMRGCAAEEAMLATVDPVLAATLAAEASTRRGGEGDENEEDAEDGADVERARHKQCLALVRAVRVREE